MNRRHLLIFTIVRAVWIPFAGGGVATASNVKGAGFKTNAYQLIERVFGYVHTKAHNGRRGSQS